MSNEKGIVLLAILLALDKLSKVSNEQNFLLRKAVINFLALSLWYFT